MVRIARQQDPRPCPEGRPPSHSRTDPGSGAACRSRTDDPRFTSAMLWPTELRRRAAAGPAHRDDGELTVGRAGRPGWAVATPIQITIDCADSGRLAAFWTQALHYVECPRRRGRANWAEYFRARGLPEEEVARRSRSSEATTRSSTPTTSVRGSGPGGAGGQGRQNRVHLDLLLTDSAGPLDERKALVDNEVERLKALGASVFTNPPLHRGPRLPTAWSCRTRRATSSAFRDPVTAPTGSGQGDRRAGAGAAARRSGWPCV